MMFPAVALPLDFDKPAWLWLGLLVPALVAVSWRTLAGLDSYRRVSALLVRSLLILLVAFCLAGAVRVQRRDALTVIFLMDRSHSVEGLQEYQENFIREAARDIPAGDKLGAIDFARDAFLEQLPMSGGFHVPPGRLATIPNMDRTNVAAAIRLAMAMFPHDTAKRMVLMSDGNDNMGDVLSEARQAKADGIPIDVVPLWYQHRNEIYFDRVIAPPHAEPGEQVAIRMMVGSDKRASGTIEFYHNGKLENIAPEAARVVLRPGTNTFVMKAALNEPGTHTFDAVFRPDDDSMDVTPLNNAASGFTFVAGTGRVLVISKDPSFDEPLVEALRSENVAADLRDVAELGEFGLLQMLAYSSIILANVPAAAFTEEQQRDFAAFVKDMGSGLIMVGGDDAFGAGGWIGSPVEEVMPVTFEIKHKRVIPRGALVVIMHSCEIPRGNFWGKEMAKKSVDTISSQDYVGVLAYTFSPGGENWEVPLGLNTNKSAVKAKIDRMQIGDMPDFGRTMEMAYKELTTGIGRDAAQKHVIILSDGDAQGPSQGLINSYTEAKITVSTIGIGWGAHVIDRELKRIAVATGGKYYAPRNPRELPQIFVKESKVVRRPLIVEEPFRPQFLHRYSELLAGIDPVNEALPPLRGMVLTSARQHPNVVVPIIRATKDGEDPVLAHWQCELGKTAVFASGFWPQWGQEWTRWAKFAKFWAQLARWTMRQETPANFDVYTKVEGNRGRIVIDALDKDASYLNFLRFDARAVTPDQRPVTLQFVQTGPGHYEAELDVDQAGQYLTNIQVHTAEGRTLGAIRTGLSVPFSPEYRDLTSNEALLRQVVEVTGGRWLDVPGAEANVFRHDIPPIVARQPAWDWMLSWLVLPLFLLDVAVRRLASWLALSLAVEVVALVVLLFGMNLRFAPWWAILGAFLLADLIGWLIRFRYLGLLLDWLTGSAAALAHAGDRSAAALERLRGTRERVRDELVASGAETEEPPPSPGGRFDVGERRVVAPAGDLREALGGVGVGPKEVKKDAETGAEAAGQAEAESTTSRLLRAKRRTKGDGENPPSR